MGKKVSVKLARASKAASRNEVYEDDAVRQVGQRATGINLRKDSNNSRERRHDMIAEAAYFLAERRGLPCGYELEDWLQAENDIDAVLVSDPECAEVETDGPGDSLRLSVE